MKTKIYLLAVLLFVAHFSVFSQEILSLDDALKQALTNKYSIVIAKNEFEISKNNNSIGNAGLLPKIDGNAGYNSTVFNTNQVFLDGRTLERDNAATNVLNLGVMLNWTLFDGMAMFINKSRLEQLQEIGENNYKIEIENSVQEISLAYFELSRTKYLIDVLTKNLSYSQDRLNFNENRYLVGSGSKLDFLQAKVDYNADVSNLKRQQLYYESLKIQFNQLLARDSDISFEVANEIKINANLNYEELKKLTLSENNQLKLANKSFALSANELKLTNASRMPRLNANAGYNFSKTDAQAGFLLSNQVNGFLYGITATIPIFDGFNKNRNYQNAKLNMLISETQLKEISNNLNSVLNIAWRNYQTNLDLMKLEEQNVASAIENVDISIEKYKIGTISNLQLKDAQENLLNAENNLINVKFEIKKSEIDLLKLSGSLIKN